MVRRSLIRSGSDQRVVKWALAAATVAFVLGSFAESKLERHVQERAAQEVVQQQAQSVVANPTG
jgi:hypothetical protein